MNSEYLSWFVLNDKEAKKGALDFVSPQPELRRVNLSIDYIEDYNRCIDLLKKINNPNFNSITFKDIIEHCNVQDIESEDKIIKLPVGNTILFNEYLNMIDNTDYLVKRKIEI